MTTEEWAKIQWFKPSEFDQYIDGAAAGIGYKMQYEFVHLLDMVREGVGFPLVIVSGMRTPDHNAEVGGVDSSAHEGGWAADIALVGRIPGIVTLRRALIVGAAWDLGLRRVGIGETFVHVDADPTKPAPRMWTYK